VEGPSKPSSFREGSFLRFDSLTLEPHRVDSSRRAVVERIIRHGEMLIERFNSMILLATPDKGERRFAQNTWK
jgi:hypothetical protein